MLEIKFSKQAEEYFDKLDRPIQSRIVKKLREIKEKPGHYIKSLTNLEYDKIRVGDYRLLVEYSKQENKLFVRELDHRKRIYK